MENETNAVGAPDGENTSVLDFDGEMESNEVFPQETAAAEPEAEQAEDTAEPAPKETEEPSENAEEEIERLRDGSTVSKREMKEAVEFRRNFERHRAELETHKAQFHQQVTQFKQQEEFVTKVLPVAIAMATENLPPEPDPALLRTDPIAHYEQTILRQAAVAKLQEVSEAQRAYSQQLEGQKQQAMTEYVRREQQALLTAMPELRDEKARQDFARDVTEAARAYGFTDQEVQQVSDHRLLKLVKDAAAYRKLMAEKPKVEAKVKEAPPVQAPSRRMTSSERQGKELRDQLSRLRKTGSAKDAESILSRFD